MRVGSNVHEKVIAIEEALTGGIPTSIAVRLGEEALIGTVADAGRALLGMLFKELDEPVSGDILNIRGLSIFFLTFGRFGFLKTHSERRIRGRGIPAAPEKVVESTDTGEETAADGKKRAGLKEPDPLSNG